LFRDWCEITGVWVARSNMYIMTHCVVPANMTDLPIIAV